MHLSHVERLNLPHVLTVSFLLSFSGFSRMGGVTPMFSKQNKSPLQTLCTDLKHLPCKVYSIWLFSCHTGNIQLHLTWSVLFIADIHQIWILFSPVMVPNRGFKTLKSRTRRLQGGFESSGEPEGFTPSFMKVTHTALSFKWCYPNVFIYLSYYNTKRAHPKIRMGILYSHPHVLP